MEINMPTPTEILKAAKLAPARESLETHSETIKTLRKKGYTWREVADFLREHGVDTDHTKLFRFMQRQEKSMNINVGITIPAASKYVSALDGLGISDKQHAMLKAHFLAHNRTITYTELAVAGGAESHVVANSHYGKLGRALGEAMNFKFAMAEQRGEPFYSSALGMDNPYRPEGTEYQLVMHHELARAIEQLGWFK